MGSQVLDFLLMLTVSSYLAPDMADNYIRFAQVFSQICLEFFSRQGDNLVTFSPGFLLLSRIKNTILKKIRCKRYVSVVFGPSGLKIVFILLTEVIALYVQIFIIEVRVPGFERSIQSIFSRFYQSGNQSQRAIILLVRLHELLKQDINRCWSRSLRGNKTWRKGDKAWCWKTRVCFGESSTTKAIKFFKAISGSPRVVSDMFLDNALAGSISLKSWATG